MNIDRIYSLIFSPAGHTRSIVGELSLAWDRERTELDLTDHKADFSTWSFSPSELCVVGVPAFGGRVPAVAVERLMQMQGNQTPAVIVASYGNRAQEDTLLELKNTLVQRDFVVVAAVAAVAEHSILPRFAAGRPNVADRGELRAFGEQVWRMLEQSRAPEAIPVPGNYPYRAYGGVPLKPSANRKCTFCGLCAKQCPVGAIPESAPNRTEKPLCISCMRCVVICPEQSRRLPAPLLWLAGRKLKKFCSNPKKNEFYC